MLCCNCENEESDSDSDDESDNQKNKLSDWIGKGIDWIFYDVIYPLWKRATTQKSTFLSGTLLFLGILVEYIPHLVVTFPIEDKIKSNNPNGNISNAAFINLVFAIFDILHNLAEAFDLRSDVLNPGYLVIRTIKLHSDWVTLLAFAGSNCVLSASGDETAKLWDAATGKCVQVFKCGSLVNDAMALGTSKVITATDEKRICIFYLATGVLESEPGT